MPQKHRLSEFVLSPFDRDEKATAREMILRAADAVITLATQGITTAMNRFNS
jgi:peptidyl-tRNA hydrolase